MILKQTSKQIPKQILMSRMSRMSRMLRIFTPPRPLILVLENKTTALTKARNDVIEVYVIEYLWDELYELVSIK